MNATYRFAVKACVLAAVSGALFNQAVGIFAQDGRTSPSDGSTNSSIRRTASYQSQEPSQPGASQPSEVQKKLQELYRKNGREMPSMNMEDLPNTQPVVPPPAAAVQPAPNVASAATGGTAPKASKPNFFERLFRVGKGRKQPAPATAQPARPAAPPMQPFRYPQTQQPARPAAPVYRPPLVSAPAPRPTTQPTTQPQLREPAPIGNLTNPLEAATRPATPALRPGQRSGIGQPLMDDTDSQDDSESLELNHGDQKKVASQPPQILPNQSANGPAESPFTGVKIAPNEMEQRIASTPKAAIDAAPTVKAELPEQKTGAPKPSAGPALGEVTANLPPAAKSPAAPKTDDLGIKDDDDDDDDDDDEPLTLSTDATGKTAAKPIVPVAEKPAKEKEIEKSVALGEMKGFRGFCPVILKDERKLIEARPHIQSEYRGKVYTFSSVDAKEAFEENPRKYIPAGDGQDVVKQMAGEEGIEGTLEHAAWYRGRLYLFSSAESRREFVETPSKFVVND
jgi:YHS domain-containing protein